MFFVTFQPSIASWRIIFGVTIALYVLEAVMYVIFGSGEQQKWNDPEGEGGAESQPLKSPGSPNSQDKQGYDATRTSTLEAK